MQIGAGTGAPGMVAALMGAAVTLTDRRRMEQLLNRNAAFCNQAIMCGCGEKLAPQENPAGAEDEEATPSFGYARFAPLEWGGNVRRLTKQCPTPEAAWGVDVLPCEFVLASDVCVGHTRAGIPRMYKPRSHLAGGGVAGSYVTVGWAAATIPCSRPWSRHCETSPPGHASATPSPRPHHPAF